MNKIYDVFISYSSTDKAAANIVTKLLEQNKIKCWIAPRDIEGGESYPKEIVDAIKASKIMVLIFSSEVNNSDPIKNEVELASKYKLTIIPFRIEDIAPTDDFEFYLNRKHWVDAFTSELENHIGELSNTVNSALLKDGDIDDVSSVLECNKQEKNKIKNLEEAEPEPKPKNSFNWKALMVLMAVLFLLGFGYFGYQKYNKDTQGVNNSESYSFGESLKPNSLKSIYGAKKDKNFNWSGWKEQLIINNGDKSIYITVHYEVHYNAYDTSLENIRLGLSKFPLNIDANEKINISSFITADNAQPIIGNISIHSLSDIELIPEKISLQENNCKSASCETQLPNYSSENKKIIDLFKRGINVGNKLKGHYGNLIIRFRIRHKEKAAEAKNTKEELSDNIDNKQLTTNEDPNNIPTLLVNNKLGTRWLPSVNVRAGDSLGFNVHYYGWHKGINDLSIKIDKLGGRVFKEDEKITVHAVVASKNLSPSYGEVNVIFDEPVELKFRRISWQKNKCKSRKCETPTPYSSDNIFSQDGLSLGDIFARDGSDYYGNIVVSYDVVKNKPIKN